MRYANLHTHTVFSDGLDTPETVVRRLLLTPDIALFSVTDHDSLSAAEPVTRVLPSLWEECRQEAAGMGKEREPEYVPGIEMTCCESTLPTIVHLLGYFPDIGPENMRERLQKLDRLLAAHVRRIEERYQKRVDLQIVRAFEMDLDNITRHQATPEKVCCLVHKRAALKAARLCTLCGKKDDVIHHPIPLTYQDVAAVWPEIIPGGSRKKAMLYAMRPSAERQEALAMLFVEDGLSLKQARKTAAAVQGRTQWPLPSGHAGLPGMMETLALLKQAGARVSVAHPAVMFPRITMEDFDRCVVSPLTEAGLDGVEVFYPYDPSFRSQAFEHYYALVKKLGLRMSGGSDYHGDSRSYMDTGRYPLAAARDFLGQGLAS